MADASGVAYTDKFAPAGDALFDMLTSQNKATFQHGLDMEKQQKANEFTSTLEGLRHNYRMQQEEAAFQRSTAENLLKGQAVGEYVGQQAADQANKGNVFEPLVQRQNDEDVERVTGHPLFTPKPINPRAAETAHTDLQSFIQGKQRTAETLAVNAEKMIGPNEVSNGKRIAAELKSMGLNVLATEFDNLTPGSVSKERYAQQLQSAQQEYTRAQTRREVANTFGQARVAAAKIAADARKYAADAAARGRVNAATNTQLRALQGALNQEMTKMQNYEAMLRRSADNAAGDERAHYMKEADLQHAQYEDLMSAHKQITEQIGRSMDQTPVDEGKFRSAIMERQAIMTELAEAGKIRKRKSWAELNPKEQAIVEQAHRARRATQPNP